MEDTTATVEELCDQLGIHVKEGVTKGYAYDDSQEIEIDGSALEVGDSVEIIIGDVDMQIEQVRVQAAENLNVNPSFDLDPEVESSQKTVTRKRQRKANPKNWKKNKNIRLRMTGQEYNGVQNVKTSTENGEIVKIQVKPKDAKSMGPACNSNFCKNSKLRACQSITLEERELLFKNYWQNMNWSERKIYISSIIDRIKLTKGSSSSNFRKETLNYYLQVNGLKLQVCKFQFMSTLGISSKQIESWIKKPINQPAHSQQGASDQAKINNEFLKSFLVSLPKMPSHYCRKDTTKLYLEPIFNSVSQLFNEYKSKCIEEKKIQVSRWKFDDMLSELNISLFSPKKDQCDLCCGHESGNIPEEEFQEHIMKKNRARQEKEADKLKSKNGQIYALTMDLESVKVAPSLMASAVYYKTKLAVHNFTMYNLANQHSTCYWWNESEGELVASTYASCIVDYITEYCKGSSEIIIFSDGCTCQNRNSTLANALLNLSIKSQRTITQKYLEKGHTQMECDSVHAAIENKLKNRIINLPSDYYSVCREARIKPQPYDVKPLSFDFFRDYSQPDSTRYTSIRPGNKTGDPTVTDLRAIKYTPDGIIYFKLDFESEWEELPRRPRQIKEINLYPSLYTSRLKIKERKYKDLQDLKSILPLECHSFYDSLPH